jgi:hypothetical protein
MAIGASTSLGASLNFGGNMLSTQVSDETEAERKKRMAQIQQQRLSGGTPLGNSLGSLFQMSTGGLGGLT